MLRVGFALWFGLIPLLRLQGQPAAEAAAPLAARISSLLPRRATVSLEFQNLTALAPAEWLNFRGALEGELRKAGLDLAAATQPESRLRVVISENPRGLLFVAEISTKDARQVAMLPWNRAAPAETKPRIKIVKTPVWDQAEPVLDVVLLDSGSQLLVLSAGKVAGYRMADGNWTLSVQAFFTLARPPARDARGRLEFADGALRVYLPGTTCSSPLSSLRFTCSAASDPWPLNPRDTAFEVRWVTDRNLLESSGVPGAFYNAAAGLLAASDSRIKDRANDPVAGADGWGSDLAGVENPCGSSTLVIASAAGDGQAGDQVRVFEIANGQAAPASEALALPGAVTALWPADASGQVTLVVRNSKTGNYEASRLGLACAE